MTAPADYNPADTLIGGYTAGGARTVGSFEAGGVLFKDKVKIIAINGTIPRLCDGYAALWKLE